MKSILFGLAMSLFWAGHSNARDTITFIFPPDGSAAYCQSSPSNLKVECPEHLREEMDEAKIKWGMQILSSDHIDPPFDLWCAGTERFSDGTWKLNSFKSALDQAMKWVTPEKLLPFIQAWQEKNPNSVAARLVEAQYWQEQAWRARGTGYSSTVSDTDWKKYREGIAKVKAILDQPLLMKSECPEVAVIRITTRFQMGDDTAEIIKEFEEATKRHPDYKRLYYAVANYLQPKWRGSDKQFDEFARDSMKKTEKYFGAGLYAEIYLAVTLGKCNACYHDFKYMDADLAFKGFEDLIKKFPDTLNYTRKYLDMACKLEKADLYKKMRGKITGPQYDKPNMISLDKCDAKLGRAAE